MQTILNLMRARHSVRTFDSRPVPRETLEKILEAARLAPTACNNQPWRFIVAESQNSRKALAATYAAAWLGEAPVIIAACAVSSEAWTRNDGKNHADIDVAIAVDHLTLAAAAAGLGTCWVCAFDAAKAKTALGLTSDMEAVALIPIGYPAAGENAILPQKQRKPLADLVRWV